MKSALELLLQAQAKINASGITEEVSAFCRNFFAGLAYTEDASTYLFTLHCIDGGYYFSVSINLESVYVKWDVSKDARWIGLDTEVYWLFKEKDAKTIIEGIIQEFETMTSQMFVVQPELKPSA